MINSLLNIGFDDPKVKDAKLVDVGNKEGDVETGVLLRLSVPESVEGTEVILTKTSLEKILKAMKEE
jgi:hypothetical protein